MKASDILQDKLNAVRTECVDTIKLLLQGRENEFTLTEETGFVAAVPYCSGNELDIEKVYIHSERTGFEIIYLQDTSGCLYNASEGGFMGVPVQTLIEIITILEGKA